ncbi:Gfo/Idh/MocA family protein [Peristeroidobacter soli]|uniref:Gfo/Idh/MocA family protein n=1 Tax=Peristeroidobacter soli TaxID=2497877 RepID=UPI00101C0076|nr:Gfo/Idh/MocA family oxidoreductase [Peristeroidobacter soli]
MSSRREFLKLSGVGVLSAGGIRLAEGVDRKPTDRRAGNGKLRLAIVGTGQVSHKFLKQAAASQRAQFVATCARTSESAEARAKEYGIGRWFNDYNAMYDAVKPDAVVIATPSSVHAAPTIAALNRGIHVMCEKPMATTYEDCQAMVDAGRKSGAVFLNLPFDATPSFYAALQQLNEAAIGVFTGAESQLLIDGHSRANWYYDASVAGGVMLDTLVYPVSRLIAMLGPASRVTGFVNTLIPHRIVGDKTVETTIDDNVSLVIEWPGGQQALLRALWAVSWGRTDAVIYCRHGTIWTQLFGDEVVVHSPKRSIPGATPLASDGRPDCYRLATRKETGPSEGAVEHFVDCIRGLASPTCGGDQQLHVHEILFKGYLAARIGRVQELQTTFTPWHKLDRAFLDTRSRPI